MRRTRSQTQAENAATSTQRQTSNSAQPGVNAFDLAKFKVIIPLDVSFITGAFKNIHFIQLKKQKEKKNR